MIRQNLIEAAVPSPDQIFDLIVHTENHRKVAWTAGRAVLKRVTGTLERLALQGHLQRRNEPQSIGYGNEIGFDYVSPKNAL